jgi:2-polyprenyl-3-methyl-5-hydroxy-6-metoxy-1,4-benzoquinol methylase
MEIVKQNWAKTHKSNHNCSEEPFQKLLDETIKYIDEPTRQLHRMRIDLFVEVMRNLNKEYNFSSFETGLDIGCHTGFYAKFISDFGIKKMRGIDIEQYLIDDAKRLFEFDNGTQKLWFDCMPAEDLNINDRYDFILCTEVIEHTQKQKEVIEAIKTMMKPGGIAIITLPNAFSLPFFLTWLKYKIQFRQMNQELIDHLSYPFYKSLKLFESPEIELLDVTGTNLFYWMFFDKFPFYKQLNTLNFELSKTKPLCYASQFFYMVLRKKAN